MQTTPNPPQQLPMFSNLMSAIKAKAQREPGHLGDVQFDPARQAATAAIEHYLSLPLDENDGDTYTFWRNHQQTTDKAQRALCNLARIYLTPPPTSTGNYITSTRQIQCNLYIFLYRTVSTPVVGNARSHDIEFH